MSTLRFRVGDVFPATDAVARFITVVAIMSNDWLRLESQILKVDRTDPDEGGIRVMSFRQQAALYHEAASFITDARRMWPEVAAFIDGLDDEARQHCERVIGGIDSRSKWYLGDWVEDHRNVTFHYPKMHPDKAAAGQDEITNALTKAASSDGTITQGETATSVRFRFADEVVVQWLPDLDAEAESLITTRGAVLRLAHFTRSAVRAYLDSRPAGTIERVE